MITLDHFAKIVNAACSEFCMDKFFQVTLLYELLDDMYASTEWLERIEERPKSSGGGHPYETLPLQSEDNPYTVSDINLLSFVNGR